MITIHVKWMVANHESQQEIVTRVHSTNAQENHYGNMNYTPPLLQHIPYKIVGKQYLVIAGGGKLKPISRETYIAFPLPE